MKKLFVHGDALSQLKRLKSGYFQCVVTSPPYLDIDDYKVAGQIGHGQSFVEYIESVTELFSEVYRVLKDDGVLFLVIGDIYASTRHELTTGNLMGVPWRVAFALQEYGWILKQDIILAQNKMPESMKCRFTRMHEYIFLLAKKPGYYFNQEAVKQVATSPAERRNRVKEGLTRNYAHGDRFSVGERQWGDGKLCNRKSVWYIPLQPNKEHPASFAEEVAEICILAGSRPGDWVLDPMCGSGTTNITAERLGRNSLGIDLNKDYIELAKKRRCKRNGNEKG